MFSIECRVSLISFVFIDGNAHERHVHCPIAHHGPWEDQERAASGKAYEEVVSAFATVFA